jgi:hypothetical protein
MISRNSNATGDGGVAVIRQQPEGADGAKRTPSAKVFQQQERELTRHASAAFIVSS